MKINTFYISKNDYLFIFPSQKAAEVGYSIAVTWATTEIGAKTRTRALVTYKKDKFVIGYLRPEEPILVLEVVNGTYQDIPLTFLHIISGEQIGWIALDDVVNIFPLERAQNEK